MSRSIVVVVLSPGSQAAGRPWLVMTTSAPGGLVPAPVRMPGKRAVVTQRYSMSLTRRSSVERVVERVP